MVLIYEIQIMLCFLSEGLYLQLPNDQNDIFSYVYLTYFVAFESNNMYLSFYLLTN